uniref:Ig-like domain-containing protein n=1 Tax=Erpetoichthys calabaricus TaxID=27687 RepID=A0A8C4RWL7_ERPCA
STLALFFFHLPVILGKSSKENVWQTQNTVEVIQGQQVKLECHFQTVSSTPELFWYIQRPRDSPQHLLTRTSYDSNTKDFKDRFDATLDITKKTVHLELLYSRLSDSAVYFCALSSTSSQSKVIHTS